MQSSAGASKPSKQHDSLTRPLHERESLSNRGCMIPAQIASSKNPCPLHCTSASQANSCPSSSPGYQAAPVSHHPTPQMRRERRKLRYPLISHGDAINYSGRQMGGEGKKRNAIICNSLAAAAWSFPFRDSTDRRTPRPCQQQMQVNP